MNEIKILFDGHYPVLCYGKLEITAEGQTWELPRHSLCSGGRVWFDDGWGEHVDRGPWSVSEWPQSFPDHLKEAALEAINEQVPWGCCGGCI
jgi:hypothetical protein